MAITVYSSLDTGVPVLPSTSAQRLIDNLRLILVACLVDGYGAKPAAGWRLAHSHADGFTLSNGEGFISFVHVSTQTVAIYLMESLTDTSAALPVGDNRRSGPWYEGQAVTGRQYIYCPYFVGTFANKHWIVVADDRTATIQFAGLNASVDQGIDTAVGIHFGAYSPAVGGSGFCCLGGNTQSSGYTILFAANGIVAGTVLRNPFTGVVDQGASPGYRGGAVVETINYSGIAKTVISPGVLRPTRCSLQGRGAGLTGTSSANNDTVCGLLRGIVAEPALADVRASKMLPVLGVPSPTWQDKLRPLTLPNGKQWVPFYYATGDMGAFVSLDPADWE